MATREEGVATRGRGRGHQGKLRALEGRGVATRERGRGHQGKGVCWRGGAGPPGKGGVSRRGGRGHQRRGVAARPSSEAAGLHWSRGGPLPNFPALIVWLLHPPHCY